jgi:hypothetical protein
LSQPKRLYTDPSIPSDDQRRRLRMSAPTRVRGCHHLATNDAVPITDPAMSTSTKYHRPMRAVMIRPKGQNGGNQIHKGDAAPPRNIHNNRIGQVTIARGTAHSTNLGLSTPTRSFATGISAQAAISATTIQSSLDNRNTDVRSSSNNQVERRGLALPSSEADLSPSSTSLHGPPKLRLGIARTAC